MAFSLPRIPFLFRACAYGFLKNQQYYEPFLILAFREKGLSFFMIGLLVGFREACVNLLDIPSGALADLYGRRRSMIFSFLAYIVSFVIFALSDSLWMLFSAMFFFAVGEVFRTGTHKAMIFEWLRLQGRENERTKVYGQTRSWSKMGSALSALVAAGMVFFSGSYGSIFWFCIIPYTLNIINFMGYPKEVDGETHKGVSMRQTLRFTLEALRLCWVRRDLRRLLEESMVVEGLFKVSKDYLQPLLKQLALALPLPVAIVAGDETVRRGALVIGVVYCLQNLLMSFASRRSHLLTENRSEVQGMRIIWVLYTVVFFLLLIFLQIDNVWLAVGAFLGIGVLQNLFRPAQMGRYDTHAPRQMGATVLSIESQAKALFAVVLAPLVGWAVDWQVARVGGDGVSGFWPVAAVGVVGSLWVLLTAKKTAK